MNQWPCQILAVSWRESRPFFLNFLPQYSSLLFPRATPANLFLFPLSPPLEHAQTHTRYLGRVSSESSACANTSGWAAMCATSRRRTARASPASSPVAAAVEESPGTSPGPGPRIGTPCRRSCFTSAAKRRRGGVYRCGIGGKEEGLGRRETGGTRRKGGGVREEGKDGDRDGGEKAGGCCPSLHQGGWNQDRP
jgi:hypothetical protein